MQHIDEYKYKRAKERVECIKGFYGNALAYCIVIPILAYINYRTTSFAWVIFPAVGWGIGLAGHAMQTFEYFPFLGRNWEQRKIRELMDNDEF